MADCGPTVVKSDGIAFLLRRFETHIDTSGGGGGGVFTRLPEKAYRAGSILDLPALQPIINRSSPFVPTTPNGNKLIVKSSSSSSKSMESSVLSSPTSAVNPSKLAFAGEMKVDDKGGTRSQQAATGEENAIRTNSVDELASSDASKGWISSSSPQTAEADLPTAIENQGQDDFRSPEDGSVALATVCSENSGPTKELENAAERKAVKGRDAGTRFIFKQSFRENQNNATVYLDDTPSSSSSSSSSSTSNKVKELARSMENLGSSNSAAPIKDRSAFHVDKSTRVGKWSGGDSSPSTAPAALPSLANDEKTAAAAAARAKKPPPVPKKNPKVGREASGDHHQSDAAKPQTRESQTLPNLSTHQANKPAAAARPTTLFPDHQGTNSDGGGGRGDENEDDARHKSLPTLLGSARDDDDDDGEQQLLPAANAPKNTLFPCNRQKTRTRILSTETSNSTGDQGLPYSPFVTSPTSLGTRTPPDYFDSPVNDNTTTFSDKKNSSGQQSTAAAAAAAATGDVFDPDSFVSDAFDFLGSSNSAESETKTTSSSSPLKSWTDTWCKASQKRLSKATDRFAQVAGGDSSTEHRPTGEHRKEPTGNLSDKTKPQEEKTAKTTKSTNPLNVGLNKTSNAAMKPSGRDEKTKTGDDVEPPPPTHFGVVLRRTDAPSSLFRRSSIASLVSHESPSAPTKRANSRHESFVSRPVTIGKSTESVRTSDRTASVKLNRKPSMVAAGTSSALPPTAAAAPSQKPAPRSIFGKNGVSRTSSTLNRSSAAGDSPAAAAGVFGTRGAARQSGSAYRLESELNDIERAFTFLDSS